jgi:uncharacterized protein (DUF302 family)
MTTQASREKYGSTRTVNLPFQRAIERAKEVLTANGWGIMSEIDVSTAMKQKLGLDFPPYMILGTCNPELASQALKAEPNIGLLMPCNVVVREEAGKILVSVVDAEQVVSIVGNKQVDDVARKANDQLRRALEAV